MADEYDVSGWGYRLLRCARNDGASNGEGWHRPWCQKILGTDCASRPSMTGARGANFFGRSMIEMLGVLAIIGVLSVGGIAGYSKAMEKFKLNKAIGEYSMLIMGVLEHLDDFKNLGTSKDVGVTDLAQSLNLIPDSWTVHNTIQSTDAYGNGIDLYIRGKRFSFDVYIGTVAFDDNNQNPTSPNFSIRFCEELLQSIYAPLHSAAINAGVYRSSVGKTTVFWGDAYCSGGEKCLSDITLDEIHKACSSCGKTNEYCNVTAHF